MKSSKSLLAKSYAANRHPQAPPAYALLTRHSAVDVPEACGALADAIGRTALHHAGLAGDDEFPVFRRALKAVGHLEDLGKANNHFQQLVTSAPGIDQLLRHETISGILLWRTPLRDWFGPAFGDWFAPIVWAAMGHHRKFDATTQADPSLSALTVFVTHSDFAELLDLMRRDLALPCPPPGFQKNLIITTDRIAADRQEEHKSPSTRPPQPRLHAGKALCDLREDFERLKAQYSCPAWRARIALLKALGIAADVAASAVAAEGQDNYSLADYVGRVFSRGLSPSDLDQLIREWAWKACGESPPPQIVSLPPNFTVRKFQQDVADSTATVTLARAGCGSGKSLAAYLWAKAQCEKARRPNFRLFFCLPTTGTTTEHFRDYALESGLPASLAHSRACVDLKTIAETAAQEAAERPRAKDAARSALADARDKIEALALWDAPLTVCTADTVLGLMANARKSLYAFPAIAVSALVFDEVHAFDDRLFGHLLMFLRYFPNQPVLLMTASLPEHRLAALRAVCPSMHVVDGPPEFERLQRYTLHRPASDDEVWQAIERCVQAGGKVLWVRNRVAWANQTYAECLKRFPEVKVSVYHSRFRYKDRSALHRFVVDGFKQAEAQILITTQVAEMSLDLSADLLITDEAPIPSLIQRLGRLNRHATPDDPQPKLALICPLPSAQDGGGPPESPYEKADIAAAQAWLDDLTAIGGPLSQRDLAEAFGRRASARAVDLAEVEANACFVSGLWETRPGLTRSEGYTVSVILEDDLNSCNQRDRNGLPTSDWLTEHEVAVPFRPEVLSWGIVGHRRVAPRKRITYDFAIQLGPVKTMKGVGAQWANEQPFISCQIL